MRFTLPDRNGLFNVENFRKGSWIEHWVSDDIDRQTDIRKKQKLEWKKKLFSFYQNYLYGTRE